MSNWKAASSCLFNPSTVSRMWSVHDTVLVSAPQWAAIAMLASCYTLFDAPFWDGHLQSSLGIATNGWYLKCIVTAAEVGNLFILLPATIADQKPLPLVTCVGAIMVATGYSLLGLGWVSVAKSSIVVMVATIFLYSWGVAWIYSAAFVAIMSNVHSDARGCVMGTALGAFYFASSWFTEVTEYCCTGYTAFEWSAWRHMPIAGAAVLCSTALYKLDSRVSHLCTEKDGHFIYLGLALFTALAIHTYQWFVTGGRGNTDLRDFAYGDIPFAFTVLYPVMLLTICAITVRNVRRYGFDGIGMLMTRHETKNAALKSSRSLRARRSFRSLCFIFSTNIGIAQMVAYNWETLKFMFGKTHTEVAAQYNIMRVLGCLVTGFVVDRGVSRTKILLCITLAMTLSQVVLAIASDNAAWTTAEWAFPPRPALQIPVALCATSAGALYTVMPIIEVETYGSDKIGFIHGIMLLGAVGGQTLFYNLLGNFLSFGTSSWVQAAVCFCSFTMAFRLNESLASDRNSLEEETSHLLAVDHCQVITL